jgi:hypothetical protein
MVCRDRSIRPRGASLAVDAAPTILLLSTCQSFGARHLTPEFSACSYLAIRAPFLDHVFHHGGVQRVPVHCRQTRKIAQSAARTRYRSRQPL